MKKILYNPIYFLQLFCIVVAFALLSACKDEEVDPPVITEVRAYAASPNDTVVQTLNPGQWVVVLGENLSGVSNVYFGSIPASINNTLTTDHSIVVQVPSIPFAAVPRDKVNVITVENSTGATSFEINIIGAPVISKVRNYEDDVIAESVIPNQKIKIIGFNLKDATRISFQGIDVDLASVAYPDDSTIVVQVPSELSGGDASLANMISVTNKIGTGNFSIRIIGPPIITSISYEMPKEGDPITIYGNNLFSIQSLTFAGETISEFEELEDGSAIKFKAPNLTQSGPVVVTNDAGMFTSAFNVNDANTGALSNYEWGDYFKWDWWGGASLTVANQSSNEGWINVDTTFKGNGGKFLVLDVPIQKSGDGKDDNSAIRASNNNSMDWFPSVANLNDPASSWALKFEVNIPKDWEGSTLVIKTSNTDYFARYEPWQVTASKIVPFKTKGWQTVTIPFTSFRKNDGALGDGKGAPITTIKELFNMGSVNSNFFVYLHNYGTTDTKAKFRAAFDNFRVVKR